MRDYSYTVLNHATFCRISPGCKTALSNNDDEEDEEEDDDDDDDDDNLFTIVILLFDPVVDRIPKYVDVLKDVILLEKKYKLLYSLDFFEPIQILVS